MYRLQASHPFERWLKRLKDGTTRARIVARLNAVAYGHFGDHRRLDEHLFELRFYFAGGIRIYYAVQNDTVFLLCAGDKSTQSADILRAHAILHEIKP